MGLDASGDADIGVADKFLDDDEVDALFEEQGGGEAPEVVEEVRPESGTVEETTEATGEVGGIERSTGGGNTYPLCCHSAPAVSGRATALHGGVSADWKQRAGKAMRRPEPASWWAVW